MGRFRSADRGACVDDRVASAIAHWAPRFTTNGVTVSDFQRVTGQVERWQDWCAAWSRVGAEHEYLGRTALQQGRNTSAGGHLAQAAVYYHFAKFVFVDDMDQMREAHRRAVMCLTDALPHLQPPGRRVEIPFEGAIMVGILRCPAGEERILRQAELFLGRVKAGEHDDRRVRPPARGVATFSVDGPGQGEAEY